MNEDTHQMIVNTRASATESASFRAYEGNVLLLPNDGIHNVWAWKYASTLKGDLRYAPTDIAQTFALPPSPQNLAAIGERYHEFRRALMLRLIDIYNLFHAPDLDARLAKLFTKREKSPDWQAAESVPP